jgi:hypothetical protein
MLDPVDVDAERDDARVLAEVHPVGHERDQVQVAQACCRTHLAALLAEADR